MPKKKERTKEERISEELKRISDLFSDLDSKQRSAIMPLIQNAAFMKVSLEDLQEIINRDGVTEVYQNGANQYGVKQSAAVQSYNVMIKNYAAAIKTISSMIPPDRQPTESELYLEALKTGMLAKEKGLPDFNEWKDARARDSKRLVRSEEDEEAKRKAEEEHLRKINEEIARAAAKQQEQWRREGRI